MADDNLTLETFLIQLERARRSTGTGDFMDAVKATDVVRNMWSIIEAQKAALGKALHENKVRAECLDIASIALHRCACVSCGSVQGADKAVNEILAKLKELEPGRDGPDESRHEDARVMKELGDWPCVCGHTQNEHSGSGECQVEGCLCACYEEESEEEECPKAE